ncbi:helix-turn-helix transcriptional regulator [Oenococcus sicerae]|uniref:AraC family transcriptional regulator n=1 Tax=Oenococcus sicerae TaxID=2203724 RepID=A0AAJ1R9R6_9LACO|nr:AraC family transcriptional regulator [Oenococcus sicerae]MDN6900361.1 AraC family transcriptional regulator [Oenococcus sicerae]QAS69936.1 helix-turn-helix transcriptional regulator [Oenococcus sicerae]
MTDAKQNLKLFSEITDQKIFLIQDGEIGHSLDGDDHDFVLIDSEDIARIARLASLGNDILIKNGDRIMLNIPIESKKSLLLVPNEYIQRDFHSGLSSNSEKAILKVKQLAEIVYAIYSNTAAPIRHLLIYWLKNESKKTSDRKQTFKKGSKEEIFFFYQEQIAESLQGLDEKRIIKNLNEMKYLLSAKEDSRSEVVEQYSQSYLKELLVSLICSLADHAIDSGLPFNQAAKMRIELIESVYQNELLNFYTDVKTIVWEYFEALKGYNRENETDIATICRHYIDTHLTDKLALHDIAENCNVSKQSINATFKSHYDMTVKHYIYSKKIALAKNLLANNKKSLQEISNYLSFVDKSYFVKIFHAVTGMTPKQYRHQLFDN